MTSFHFTSFRSVIAVFTVGFLVVSFNAFAQKEDTRKNDKEAATNTGSSKVRKSKSDAPRNDTKYSKDNSKGRKTSKDAAGNTGDREVRKSKSDAPKNETKYRVDNKSDQRKSDKEAASNTGDRKVRESQSEGPRNETKYVIDKSGSRKNDKAISNSSGDIAVKRNKKIQDINQSKQQVLVDYSSQRKNAKVVSKYSGDVVANTGSDQRRQSKKISKYTGDYKVYESRAEGPRNSGSMVLQREINRKTQKEIARNEGDIAGNYLQKRAAMRHKKGKEIANHKGDILVKTLNQRARKIRKKNKDIANYKGDIIVTKRKKGMHPSAVYRGGKVKNSYTAKERYRKRMMRKLQRQKGAEDPNYMKQKMRKPKHNKDESEIWY